MPQKAVGLTNRANGNAQNVVARFLVVQILHLQVDSLAVALNSDGGILAVGRTNHGDGVCIIGDALPIDRIQDITRHEPGRGGRRILAGKFKHARDIVAIRQKCHGREDQRKQQVHQRAGNDDAKPLPRLLRVKTTAVNRLLILSQKAAHAADGQGAQAILRTVLRGLEQYRPHADGKLQNCEPKPPAHNIVAELVRGDQYPDKYNSCQNG